MCPENFCLKQRGAGLPVAIFIITVLALIVIGMAQLQQSSGDAVSLQIQSQRAFYAAESGAQIAVRKVLEADSCGAISSPLIFGAGALSDCSAALDCESVSAAIGGGGNTVFTIESVGQCGAGPDGARRIVEVRVR